MKIYKNTYIYNSNRSNYHLNFSNVDITFNLSQSDTHPRNTTKIDQN